MLSAVVSGVELGAEVVIYTRYEADNGSDRVGIEGGWNGVQEAKLTYQTLLHSSQSHQDYLLSPIPPETQHT